jgi:hypothetical protein
MRLFLILLLLASLVPVAAADKDEGPILEGPFSISGEPMPDMPFTLHWHPGKNIAALYVRYSESHTNDDNKDKRYAHFAHVYSLDQDRVVMYYEGFNISFCHEYPVVGDVPKKFWRGVQQSGNGQCEDGTPVTWYEGKFSTLFIPFGVKHFKLGFDKSEKPVCADITLFECPKKGGESNFMGDGRALPEGRGSLLRRSLRSLVAQYHNHRKGSTTFAIDFDDSEPEMNELFPEWLARKCDNKRGAIDSAAANEGLLAPLMN